MDNDRSLTSNKMYPIDLAPQKITIMKNVSSSEVKMAHLITPKTTVAGQIISHAGPVGLMRSSNQIISSNVASQSQPQMIVAASPILQGAQIVSQGSQILGQGSQIITQSQLINATGQIVSPGTQIISQGTQLSSHLVSTSSTCSNTGTTHVSIATSVPQVLNVGNQLGSGATNLIVNSTVRTLPPSVRVLPPLPHHNARPVLSNVSLSNSISLAGVTNSVVVSKALTGHVPRGPAIGASLAVPRARPLTPVTQPIASLNSSWGIRAPRVASPRPRTPAPAHSPLQQGVTTTASLLTTGGGVITSTVRPSPRPPQLTSPRPLPLLQRNYQPPKVVGIGAAAGRGPVGNSAPPQLYYEVAQTARPYAPAHHQITQQPVSVVNILAPAENRVVAAPVPVVTSAPAPPRPTILRKRDIEGSPSKTCGVGPPVCDSVRGEEDGGGSTTESAASSPAPSPDPPADLHTDTRKKPRKQTLSDEVRQCEYQNDDPPPTPPTPTIRPPKRPQLSSSFVCGWRATALHFVRPSDVRRRECRPRDILAIANQRHVLASAEGWKVHHLTAQMDDLVSLESDVGEQLAGVLRSVESAHGKAQTALAPHAHTLLELVKGNIQRSRIVCEGVQEAREDILRVFTHRNFVADILSRQADKRCFRKHRIQS